VKKIAALFDLRNRQPEQDIPANRMLRLRQSFRRRLSDSLEDVFHRACVEQDVRTAAGLFAVLEDVHLRRRQIHNYDRRFSDDVLLKARAALEQCREVNHREKKVA
jgi:hypothetical protein